MKTADVTSIIEKAVEGMLQKEAPKTENKLEDAISQLAKAVTAVNEKVDALSGEVVKKEKPETAEEKIAKMAETIEALTKKVEGKTEEAEEKIEKKAGDDKEEDGVEAIAAALLKMVNGEEADEEVKGQGKDTNALAEVLKSIGSKKQEDVNLDGIETHDANGNPLTEKQRIARKALDDHFGGQLESFAKSKGYGEGRISDDEDDD
jgi:hypothetical protein